MSRRKELPFIIIAAVLLAAVGGGIVLFRSRTEQMAAVSKAEPAASASPMAREIAPGADPPHFRGGAQASVVLEEFADFQCPSCAALTKEVKRIAPEFGDRLKIVYRNFPLTSMHKNALDAARAAEAAGMQGRFWEMHDLLYDAQPRWAEADDARAIFAEYARTLRLDVERFRRDMDGQIVNARIMADMQRGRSLGVVGTPTVFIDGKEIPYQMTTADSLRTIIKNRLGEKR
ncbi:MAG: hypothetical protein C4334_06740 [Pyrinomonas sp.]|uniref:DsbA family protein n=1 Tax=Pyrinomonas sp. TaxID=2080306 RepID=UPI00331DBB75